MKKAVSDSGTIHLFKRPDVLRRNGTETATSVCGSFETTGPFTGAPGDSEVEICENCANAIGE